MPGPASRANSIKQLSKQQSSAAASPTPSGAADKQSNKRQIASKPSKSIPTTVFPDADNLPSIYAASSKTTAAASGPGTGPSTQQQQQQEAADAALYRDMRSALAEFESQQRKLSCTHASTAAAGQPYRPARMPPRQTAFYAALRSVLQQVLAETTPAGTICTKHMHHAVLHAFIAHTMVSATLLQFESSCTAQRSPTACVCCVIPALKVPPVSQYPSRQRVPPRNGSSPFFSECQCMPMY